MTPFLQDADVTLYHGDALEILRQLPSESVHCVATSPPFYGLRDYGVDGQIGLEETPEQWADRLVEVFRECRRVLRRDGTLWVECGDSYANTNGIKPDTGNDIRICDYCAGSGVAYEPADPDNPVCQGCGGTGEKDETTAFRSGRYSRQRATVPAGLKAKDLLGTPWLLAFALRQDGWWLRGCNIWAKPNAMPESAKDRCTTAHSYVFHFAKSARYFFDGDAIREPHVEPWRSNGGVGPTTIDRAEDGYTRPSLGEVRNYNPLGSHPRSVWQIPTQGYPDAHFATWPEALARRIILAAVPEQVCGTCGKARERIVERGELVAAHERGNYGYASRAPDGRTIGGKAGDKTNTHRPGMSYETTAVGFTDCGHSNYTPGVILDPFGGSGTTALVARKHGRHSILIELNADYCQMAARRLQQLSLLA